MENWNSGILEGWFIEKYYSSSFYPCKEKGVKEENLLG